MNDIHDSPLKQLLKAPQKNAQSGDVPPATPTTPQPVTFLTPVLPPVLDARPTITIQFRGCIMRILNPKTTALVFSTGKIVVTGARCEEASHLAARKFAKVIQKIGFKVRPKQFRICNMVGMCDVRFPIKVDALNQVHAQFCSYEPEIFPGLIYRVVKPRVVLLIFVNGKIVLTGAKTKDEMHDALDMMLPILRSFRKQ